MRLTRLSGESAPSIPAWMVPGPWRSLAVMLLAGALGTAGGVLSGPAGEDPFQRPARVAPDLLQASPRAALPAFEETLALSTEFVAKETSQTDLGSSPDAPESGPAYQAWGRSEVHRAAFWRPGPSTEPGPIEIQAEVAAYRDPAGAQQAFAYWRERLSTDWTPWSPDIPGADAAGFEVQAAPFTFQWVQFRKANGMAILVVTGPAGEATRETAGTLAGQMAERMR